MDIPSGLILFLIIFELAVLFYFSRQVSRLFGSIFLRISRSQKVTIWLLALFFLPGTIVHELAHALTAGVLMVHVGSVEFVPEIQEGGVKLGSAQIGQTDPIRRALIGLSPILVGLGLLLGLLMFLGGVICSGQVLPLWEYPLLAYLLFEIANTMFSSKKDLEGFGVFLAIMVCLFGGLYLADIRQPFYWFQSWTLGSGGHFLELASELLLIPIFLDLIIVGLARMVVRR